MLILSPSMGSFIFGKQIKISSDLLCPTILILPYPKLSHVSLIWFSGAGWSAKISLLRALRFASSVNCAVMFLEYFSVFSVKK